jgi:glyoxylase-like metal-dependent hydrolase (beta-lactamase superfamily II)
MPLKASRKRVFKIGDFECRVLYDGSRSIRSMTGDSAKGFIFGDAPEAEVDTCLRHYGVFDSSTILPFNYLLVKGRDQVILLDTGCGDQAENDKHPDEPAGLLVNDLSEAGLSADDVDTVIVSHWHWDHFGGAVVGGEVAYPNADYVMSEREADHIRVNVKDWALDYLNIIGDKARFIPDIAEVSPGITVKLAPGHTPGIIVTEVSSGEDTLLYTSDIIIHQAHIEHTDWIPSFETDRIAAIASRRNLIEESHRRNLLLFVPHIPTTLGRVEHSNAGYKWVDEHV